MLRNGVAVAGSVASRNADCGDAHDVRFRRRVAVSSELEWRDAGGDAERARSSSGAMVTESDSKVKIRTRSTRVSAVRVIG